MTTNDIRDEIIPILGKFWYDTEVDTYFRDIEKAANDILKLFEKWIEEHIHDDGDRLVLDLKNEITEMLLK